MGDIFETVGRKEKKIKGPALLTGVSYKWYASVAGLPNLYSVIDG